MSESQETQATQSKPSSVSSSKPGVVRFWSVHSSYKIAVQGRNITFKNHIIDLNLDDSDVAVLRKLKSPYIREVVDRPFGGEKELARFNKVLNDLIFTGERGEASKRGVISVRAMLSAKDCEDMVVDGMFDPSLLIMRVLKTKSFKEGI